MQRPHTGLIEGYSFLVDSVRYYFFPKLKIEFDMDRWRVRVSRTTPASLVTEMPFPPTKKVYLSRRDYEGLASLISSDSAEINLDRNLLKADSLQ